MKLRGSINDAFFAFVLFLALALIGFCAIILLSTFYAKLNPVVQLNLRVFDYIAVSGYIASMVLALIFAVMTRFNPIYAFFAYFFYGIYAFLAIVLGKVWVEIANVLQTQGYPVAQFMSFTLSFLSSTPVVIVVFLAITIIVMYSYIPIYE